MEFTFEFTARDFGSTIPMDSVRFSKPRYSFTARRGPDRCRFKAFGNVNDLLKLIDLLRCQIKIKDSAGRSSWWGCVWEVTVYDGAFAYKVTLTDRANRIRVDYTRQASNQAYSGAGFPTSTDWKTDATSISDFGTMERKVRLGSVQESQAVGRRNIELSLRSDPINGEIIVTPQPVADPYADIICYGWWRFMNAQYCENTTGSASGQDGHTTLTNEIEQKLGQAFTKTTIAFHSASFAEIVKRSSMELTQSDGLLGSSEYIAIEGSAANTGIKTITAMPWGGRIYTLATPPAITEEAAGPSVTVKVVGQRIRRKFTLSANNPFRADAIDIRCRKSGPVTDSLLVRLYADSAGLGSLLATGTVSGNIISETMQRTTFSLDTPIDLVYGTQYWVVVDRSGSAAEGNYYLVGFDDSTSNTDCELYSNAAGGWLDHPSGADLIFWIAGTRQTTELISAFITAFSQYVTQTNAIDASGYYTSPYKDGEDKLFNVIDDLLSSGASDGSMLLSRVNESRQFEIFKAPAQGDQDYQITSEGEILSASEEVIQKHLCPHGRWATFGSLVVSRDKIRRGLIWEIEYDGERDVYTRILKIDGKSNFDIVGFE